MHVCFLPRETGDVSLGNRKKQSFGLFCAVLGFTGLTEMFHEPVFIYPLSPDCAPAKITQIMRFTEALEETQFQSTLESAFVPIGWFPE